MRRSDFLHISQPGQSANQSISSVTQSVATVIQSLSANMLCRPNLQKYAAGMPSPPCQKKPQASGTGNHYFCLSSVSQSLCRTASRPVRQSVYGSFGLSVRQCRTHVHAHTHTGTHAQVSGVCLQLVHFHSATLSAEKSERGRERSEERGRVAGSVFVQERNSPLGCNWRQRRRERGGRERQQKLLGRVCVG